MAKQKRSVLQDWVMLLPMMQQTVLLTAIRGPDGVPKEHPAKGVLRWYRRCVLLSAMDGRVLTRPEEIGGGSFTGPATKPLHEIAGAYIKHLDEMPHHCHIHILHAAQIVGYKHPDESIRGWWRAFYFHLVNDLHLMPESQADMDRRLGDSLEDWQIAELGRPVQMEDNYQRPRRKPGAAKHTDASLRWPRLTEDDVAAVVEKLSPVAKLLEASIKKKRSENAKRT